MTFLHNINYLFHSRPHQTNLSRFLDIKNLESSIACHRSEIIVFLSTNGNLR